MVALGATSASSEGGLPAHRRSARQRSHAGVVGFGGRRPTSVTSLGRLGVEPGSWPRGTSKGHRDP
jgi:hypothetical protein